MKSMRFLFGLCLLGSAALGQEIQLTPTVVTSLATKAASNYFAANGSSSSAFTRSLSGATNSAAFVDIFGSWPVDAIGWQFSGLGYAVESRITSTNGGLLGNTNNVGYWTVYSISFIQQVTNDLIVTNLEMYGGGTYNGSSIQGWPSLWLYTFSSLPSQIVLNSAGTGYVTNFTYYDLKHEWNSHSPTSYYLTNGVPVSAGNYIVAIMRFDGNFGWWDANYFDTNSSSFINRFPLYGTNSDTTTLGMLDTNRYASAEMNVSGYYTTSATNFSQYTDYIKAGINSNIVLNAQTTNALVATNAVITNALISLSNNVVAQINSANSALQDHMRTNAPTTGFTTNLLAQSTADRFMGAFGTWKAQHISGFYDPAGLYYLTNTTDNIFPPYQTLYLHGLGFVQLVTNTAIVTNICVYVGGMDQATNCDVRVFVTNALPAYLSLSDPHCVFSTNTLVPAFAISTHFQFCPGAILVPENYYVVISVVSTNTSSDYVVSTRVSSIHVNYGYNAPAGYGTLSVIGYDYGYPVLQGSTLTDTKLDLYLQSLTNQIAAANASLQAQILARTNFYVLNVTNLIISGATVPATAGSAGLPGQIAWDATGFYVCVATNSWKRMTLTDTWP